MAFNRIQYLYELTFYGLTKLKTLNLNNNQIETIKMKIRRVKNYALSELINLRYLYMESNIIEIFEPYGLSSLDYLAKVCLYDNNLTEEMINNIRKNKLTNIQFTKGCSVLIG